MAAAVDSGELSAEHRDLVSKLLTQDVRGPGVSRPGGADQFSYELEIQEGDRMVRRHWDEGEVHESVRPLLAALTREAKPVR